MYRAIVPVVVALTLGTAMSGCLWFGGHCGPFYEDAQWHEPGLYEAMGGEGIAAVAPGHGFPFDHEVATSRWGDDVTVQQVTFFPSGALGRGEHGPNLNLAASSPDGRNGGRPGGEVTADHVTVVADETVSNATLRTHLHTLLNATGTAPAEADAWITALLQNRTLFGTSYGADREERRIYSASRAIETGPDLSSLADRLGGAETQGHRATTGTAALVWKTENGTWSFHLKLPVRSIDVGGLGTDEEVTLRVDPGDAVTANMPQELGNRTETYQERLAVRLAEEGLPPPTYTGFEMDMAVC